MPSELKVAFGVTHVLENDMTIGADILFTEAYDSAMIMRGDLVATGNDADGYPIYPAPTVTRSFKLTNSNQEPQSLVLSFGLEQEFENGFYYRLGYAYTDSEDVQPMTSSVAFSNYQNRAFFDPQEDVISTSNYEIKNRFSFATRWKKELASNVDLTVALYGHVNSGRPYSYGVRGNSAGIYSFSYLYINDEASVLEPGDTRNGETGSYWRKLDARVTLDFPGFADEHRASAFLVIDNLTNLLNDDWGILRQHNFPYTVTRGTSEPRIGDASRYEIRFGVQYSF